MRTCSLVEKSTSIVPDCPPPDHSAIQYEVAVIVMT